MTEKKVVPPEAEEIAKKNQQADTEVELPQDDPEPQAEKKAENKKPDKKAEKAAKKAEIDKLNAEIEKITAQKDEYLAALQRERADFDNFKKRNAMAATQAFARGTEAAVEKFLPVADNLERAIAAAEGDDPLKKGVEMVLRQILEVMAALGIEEIEAQGQQFDPNLHNAVMQVEAEDGQESGVVCEVLQKGYKAGDHVVRHSMVKVTQ